MKRKIISGICMAGMFSLAVVQTHSRSEKAVVAVADKVIYPDSLPSSSFLPVMEMVYPEFEFEEIDLITKEVTLQFSLFDREHVRSIDPKRFREGAEEYIYLSLLSDEDFVFPLPGGRVISPYAGRRVNHTGIDLKTFRNDTIVSAFDGVVRLSKFYSSYGNVVVVRHYNGLETVYSHNSKNLVKPGAKVKAGDALALVGRTGRASTEHLHFEVRMNGQHFDPELIIDMKNQMLRKQNLLCRKRGASVSIRPIDVFEHQLAGSYCDPNPFYNPSARKQLQ
ncbi:M23 family metallopeptidase [Parabacteroides sp. OttesenSCG-928-N08]|nr:M23 family metallopeptidase [Parabacteroides sp. OttesenSCG-928-N08]